MDISSHLASRHCLPDELALFRLAQQISIAFFQHHNLVRV
jgi:hypothetical protein